LASRREAGKEHEGALPEAIAQRQWRATEAGRRKPLGGPTFPTGSLTDLQHGTSPQDGCLSHLQRTRSSHRVLETMQTTRKE